MRHHSLLKNNGLEQSGNSFISHISMFFSEKKKTTENVAIADFSKAKKSIIWIHLGSWKTSEILLSFIKLFAKEQSYIIVGTYSSSLPARHVLSKDYDGIDHLYSLPTDNVTNAALFVKHVKPSLALFANVDDCSCFVSRLYEENVPTFLISFQAGGLKNILSWHVSFKKNVFKAFTHIFVFDNASKCFLEKRGVNNVSVETYPPLDVPIPKIRKNLYNAIIEHFSKTATFVLAAGNIDTEKDLKLAVRLIQQTSTHKCLIAPYTISTESLQKIEYEFKGQALLYSECDEMTDFSHVKVLVLDFLCEPSLMMYYASCVYVGSAPTMYRQYVLEALYKGIPMAFDENLGRNSLPFCLSHYGIGQMVKTPNDMLRWAKCMATDVVRKNKRQLSTELFVDKSTETTNRIFKYISSFL